MHCRCIVIYEGRAKSYLKEGDYIIIKKPDGTILIHGASKQTPLNFQCAGANISINKNELISERRREKLTIKIIKIHHYYLINEWSNNEIEIRMTENDLRNHIKENLEELLKEKIIKIEEEYPTKFGPIDLLAIDVNNVYHVIEIKRKKASISACSQVDRYLSCINENKKGWIMSPSISKNALNYLNEKNINWLEVTHQTDINSLNTC